MSICVLCSARLIHKDKIYSHQNIIAEKSRAVLKQMMSRSDGFFGSNFAKFQSKQNCTPI